MRYSLEFVIDVFMNNSKPGKLGMHNYCKRLGHNETFIHRSLKVHVRKY